MFADSALNPNGEFTTLKDIILYVAEFGWDRNVVCVHFRQIPRSANTGLHGFKYALIFKIFRGGAQIAPPTQSRATRSVWASPSIHPNTICLIMYIVQYYVGLD